MKAKQHTLIVLLVFVLAAGPTEETMHLLRIHNYEDVLHMIDLLSVLSYLEVLNGQYTILSHRIDHYHAYDGTEGDSRETASSLSHECLQRHSD